MVGPALKGDQNIYSTTLPARPQAALGLLVHPGSSELRRPALDPDRREPETRFKNLHVQFYDPEVTDVVIKISEKRALYLLKI